MAADSWNKEVPFAPAGFGMFKEPKVLPWNANGQPRQLACPNQAAAKHFCLGQVPVEAKYITSDETGLRGLRCMCDTAYGAQKDQTFVAFWFQGKWRSMAEILERSDDTRHGLIQVAHDPTHLDRLTLHVLTRIYAGGVTGDGAGFKSSPIRERAKIMWLHGRAIGFYSYQYPGDFAEGVGWEQEIEHAREYTYPKLNHIYVRKEYRRHGYASAMVNDFFRPKSDKRRAGKTYQLAVDTFAIESPVAENMEKALLKILTVAEKGKLLASATGRPFLPENKLKVQMPEERQQKEAPAAEVAAE